MPELHFDLHLPHSGTRCTGAARGLTAVMGPNGAGKSTLLRVVLGLEPGLLSGSVGGQALDDRPTHARKLGWVQQSAALFPHLTVAQNVHFAGPCAREWLDLLGVSPLLSRYPAALSGGEQARVAIARALGGAPEALLLDEPLAAVAWGDRAAILSALKRFPGAILWVTHHPAMALEFADATCWLADTFHAPAPTRASIAAGRLPNLLRTLTDQPVLVAPDAILLSTREPVGLSARYCRPAVVQSVDGRSVHCDMGEPVTAELSRRAISELGLAPGAEVWVVIKDRSMRSTHPQK